MTALKEEVLGLTILGLKQWYSFCSSFFLADMNFGEPEAACKKVISLKYSETNSRRKSNPSSSPHRRF